MTDLKNTWVLGEQYAHTDQNAIATAVNANTHAAPQYGTLPARPSPGNAGLVYYATDHDSIYKDNGTAWDRIQFGDSGMCSASGWVPTTGWTAVNMPGAATWAQNLDSMLLTIPSSGSTDSLAYQYRNYPSPPFTLTTYLDFTPLLGLAYPTAAGSLFLGGITTSDGTKCITFGPMIINATGAPYPVGAGVYLAGIKWSTVTAASTGYNATYTPIGSFLGKIPKWYRYTDDGTNISFLFSMNGVDWVTVASEARTTFLTPGRIGIGADNHSGSSGLIRVRSWSGVA